MSERALDYERATRVPVGLDRQPRERHKVFASYGAAVILVATAVLIGFVVDHVIAAPNVALVFVLPVVIAATSFGFAPAMLAAALSVLAFDFFFTEPLYSLRIHSAADIWATALLLAIAAIASTVAAEGRQRAVDAGREADRASALHELAHLVVQAAPSDKIARATAQALSRIFQAPATVLVEGDGALLPAASSPGAVLSAVDVDAANWVLANQTPSHGESYPFDASTFDFWPIRRQGSPSLVLGVRCGDIESRPRQPAKYVELAGAYLAASLAAPPRRRPTSS